MLQSSPFPRWLSLLLLFLVFFVVVERHHAVYGLSSTSRTRRRNTRPPPPSHGHSSKSRASMQKNEVIMLSNALRMIYNQGGTVGVLQQSEGMEEYEASILVQSAMEASRGDKGMASGILNALLGYCCKLPNATNGAKLASNLMKAYDLQSGNDDNNNNNSNNNALRPDLVALSLAHVATLQCAEFADESEEYLRRAEEVHAGRGTLQSTTTTTTAEVHDEYDKKLPTTVDWNMLQKVHDIQLLQEADEFVVVSKPSGMVCYHPVSSSTKQTSNSKNNKRKRKRQTKHKNDDKSLEDCLLESGVPLSTLNKEGRGMVHRIDRGTSGCIIIAKTNRMHSILMAQFFLRNVSKSYQALVSTTPNNNNKLPKKGVINLDIDGRPATSKYYVEQRYPAAAGGGGGITRIKIETEQGRRHQVRIHCSRGLQAPILLDPSYGGLAIMSSSLKSNNNNDDDDQHISSNFSSLLQESQVAKRFCLHADRLAIPGQGIEVTAPFPKWWRQLEEELLVDQT